MIWFGLILAGAALVAFAAVVVSIHRSERRKSLFSPAQDGRADAFTRRVLAVHVHQPRTSAPSQDKTASCSLVRR